jgi:hypothetical protein
MVWIQAWADPHEFIHAGKIESVYYRSIKKGHKEDWIELVASPQEKVILQFSVNAGNYPKNAADQKAWHTLVDARAFQIVTEVIRTISDPALSTKIIHLKELIKPDFGREAPHTLDIEIWIWDISCHSCHQNTPVVYPVGAFFGYMLEFNFLSNLPKLLAEHYPFFRMTRTEGKEEEEYRNTCTHCGESQPDWLVMESYLELVNTPDVVSEKFMLNVPLTEEERNQYQKAGIASAW